MHADPPAHCTATTLVHHALVLVSDMRSRQQSLFFRRFVDASMSRLVPVLPAAAQAAGQSSEPEKIRKRMSLHKLFHIRCLGQFVSDMLGHPPIPNTKLSMLAMYLMSTWRQKKFRFRSTGKAPDLAINLHANDRGPTLFAMLPPTRRCVKRPLLPSPATF